MNGKYISFKLPIWSLTKALTLANELSKAIDHLDGTSLVLLFAIKCKPTTKKNTKKLYKAKFVKVKLK